MNKHNVKGIVLQSGVEGVRELVDAGRLTESDLLEILEPQDLEYLKSPVAPSLWYPVDVCGRYIDVMWEASGHAPGFLEEHGATACRDVFATGVYKNLMETAKRWGPEQTARALVTLGSQLYDFMEWSVHGDFESLEYTIEVNEASEWPDCLRSCSTGFIEVLHSNLGVRPVRVRSRRPSRARVIYEISPREA